MKSNIYCTLVVITVFALILTGCQSKPDFEALRSEILALHRTMIQAHWNKDVYYFTQDISDDYMSVSNGEIRHPTKEDISAQFTDYLNNTTFTEYRNLRDPIIGFSKDGSLAWSVVQVRVAGRRTMHDGVVRDFDDTWAWITLYERRDDKWIRLGEVSSIK
jgi:hypothetical protein